MILHHHLVFSFGVLLLCREMLAVPQCSVEGQIGYFNMCNITWIPHLPEDIVVLYLDFNLIREVTATSFPMLERLLILSLGSQLVYPVAIGKEAFRNLPNLTQLDLGGNIVVHLDPDAFVGLFHVQILRLYYNGLDESILEEDYLRDMVALEYLDLAYNKIIRLQPHRLFYKMPFLDILNLKLNSIKTICEGDLDSFQGKAFKLFILNSNSFYRDNAVNCGNPFKNITIDTLDVGSNGWNVDVTREFCMAIQGTPLTFLKLSQHIMGSSFDFNNIRDPDSDTFSGLARSGLRLLDISHGSIFILKDYVFQYLTDLELLDLNQNNINRIEKAAFFGLGNLKLLNLSCNLLGELPSGTFQGLYSVVNIDLQHNHIGKIGGATFKNLPRLETLDLRDNALKTIESLPDLSTVLLGDNRLKSIVGFKNLSAISATNLDLKGNRLEDLGDLYELLQVPFVQIIILQYNRLSYCRDYKKTIARNNQLIYLDLGNNMLKLVWERKLCLDVFQALSKLEVLHLNNNYLSFLPEGLFSGLVSLKRLNLASNLLTYISHNALPKRLKKLELSSNQLLYPDPQLFATLDYLDITYNRYYCDCPLSSLIVWLNQTNTTIAGSPDEMFCFAPPAFAGVSLYKLAVDDCDEDKVLEYLRFSLFIFTCVALTLFLVVVIVFTHFRGACFVWYKTITRAFLKELQPELEKKTYDAYLCYSRKDFEWVQNSLIKHLDSQYSVTNRFALCFEDRDFLPGEDHINNIRDAIWNSRKTICVVTKHFLKDGWCVEAFNFAQSRYFCDLKDVLVMVVVGSVSQYQLMKFQPVRVFMQRSRYLRWPEDPQDVEWFLNMLSHQILKEKKVKRTKMLELTTITVS